MMTDLSENCSQIDLKNPVFSSGLIRATSNQNNNRASLSSISSINARLEENHRHNETVEEEKVQRDNSATEKQTVECFITPSYSFISKSPSVSNSITVSGLFFDESQKNDSEACMCE